jgi:hypothetical protein
VYLITQPGPADVPNLLHAAEYSWTTLHGLHCDCNEQLLCTRASKMRERAQRLTGALAIQYICGQLTRAF